MSDAAGPSSLAEILLAGIAFAVVILAFYLAVRYTLKPGEQSRDHIKRRVIEDDKESHEDRGLP